MNLKPKKKKRPRCGHPDCNRASKTSHECLTCERLGKKVYIVHICKLHQEWGGQRIRRHALTAHPVNILRAGVAALKGEDIF